MVKLYFKAFIVAGLLALTYAFQMCTPSTDSQSSDIGGSTPYVSIEGQKFIDPDGRHLILHGINLVNKDPNVNYLGSETAKLFVQMKQWGFNCVRLGVIWDGLEPEPGQYDENYLQGIDQRIRWAEENGLYVFLDMHQDLFSVKFSDGAPIWATLDEGKPHVEGLIWDDSYFISPAVQTSIDNFWKNKEAEDGMGIQDHYINAWKHVADRYRDNPIIIGFDLMNEPFMGSEAQQIMPVLFEAYGTLLAEETGKQPPTMEEIMMIWSNEESRMEILQGLSDAETYGRLMDSTYPMNAAFESNVLQKFYQKVRDSIRTVDENHIIFIEHSYFSNTGVRSAINPLIDSKGVQDPLVAYAPHAYDLVTDTKALGSASDDRVAFIFNRIKETTVRLQLPALIGEWGAFHGKNPDLIPVARFVIKQINRHLFSDTFWAYYDGLENEPFFKEIVKPYPISTSGDLKSYQFHVASGIFRCSWEEDPKVTASTIIYLPDITEISNEDIDLRPAADRIIIDEIEGSKGGYLIISPTGEKIKRSVRLTILKKSSQLTSLQD